MPSASKETIFQSRSVYKCTLVIAIKVYKYKSIIYLLQSKYMKFSQTIPHIIQLYNDNWMYNITDVQIYNYIMANST